MINSKIVVALALSCCNYDHVSLTISAAFSPIMNTTAFVCAAGMSGTEKKYTFHIEMLLSRRKFRQNRIVSSAIHLLIEASTTRKRSTPYTCKCGFTTASASVEGPILHVPT